MIISVTVEEALLDEIEAFTSFCLVLLSYVLGSVTETGFLEEVVFGALVKTGVAVVFVRAEKLHRVVVLSNSQFVELVQWVLMASVLL